MTSTGASGASDSEESCTDQYEPIHKLAMVQLQPPRNPNKPFTAFSIKDILGHRHTSSSRESNGDRGSGHTGSPGFEPSTGSVVVVSVTDDDDETNSERTATVSPSTPVITKSHSTSKHHNHHHRHHHHHHHHNQQHNHYKTHGNSNNNISSSGKSSPVGIISTETSLRLLSHDNNNRVSPVLTNNNNNYANEKNHYHHQQQNKHHHHTQSRLYSHYNHPHHQKSTTIGTPSPPPAPASPTPHNNNNNNTSLKSHTHHHHVHHLQPHRGTLVLGTTTSTTNSNTSSTTTTTTTTTTINGARIVRPWDTGLESDNNTSSDIDADEEINVDDDTPIPSIVKTVSPLDALMEMANKTFEGLETSEAVESKRREQAALFGKHQPPKKRRKSRTAFTNQQIYELEKRFLYQKYLTPADRDEIALSLGLTNAQVITWFQNRRAKLKRDLEEMKNDVEHAKVISPPHSSVLVKQMAHKAIDCDSLSQQPMIEDEEESMDNSLTS